MKFFPAVKVEDDFGNQLYKHKESVDTLNIVVVPRLTKKIIDDYSCESTRFFDTYVITFDDDLRFIEQKYINNRTLMIDFGSWVLSEELITKTREVMLFFLKTRAKTIVASVDVKTKDNQFFTIFWNKKHGSRQLETYQSDTIQSTIQCSYNQLGASIH